MGTNYYVHEKVCEHCGSSKKEVHIGKKSAGSKFCFDGSGDFKNSDEWTGYLSSLDKDSEIRDEYGEKYDFLYLWSHIIEWNQDYSPVMDRPKMYPEHFYSDSNGYEFSTREFS